MLHSVGQCHLVVASLLMPFMPVKAPPSPGADGAVVASPVNDESIPKETTESLLLTESEIAAGKIKLAQVDFAHDQFTFARVRWSSIHEQRGPHGRWATDYPDADTGLTQRVAEWTTLKTTPDGVVVRLTDDNLSHYPFLYMAEPGTLMLSDAEVLSLREYLLNGGFLMADDFWGDAEWAHVKSQIRRVFPDNKIVDLPLSHAVFQAPFTLKQKPQVCSIGAAMHGASEGITWERSDGREVHYWGISDDTGRLMVILCHNTDLGDGWERSQDLEWYAAEFSEKRAYPMAMNIISNALKRVRE